MNGLKLIRRRCNVTASALAKRLGVTRQMVSAWENGRKKIPDERKCEIAAYFGVAPHDLEEITEEEKERLLRTSMCMPAEQKGELRFGSNAFHAPVPVDDEGKTTLGEQMDGAMRREKKLVKTIEKQILGGNRLSIMDELQHIHSRCDMLDYFTECISAMESQSGIKKRLMEYEIKDVLDGLMIFLKRRSEDDVLGRMIKSDGLLRMDHGEITKSMIHLLDSGHKKYVEDYKRIYGSLEHRIFTYGIEDIRPIVNVFADQFDIIRADGAFTDILAINSDAVFLNPDSLTEHDVECLNEIFPDGNTLVIFTRDPWYRLKFQYDRVDPENLVELQKYRSHFEQVRMNHIKNIRI